MEFRQNCADEHRHKPSKVRHCRSCHQPAPPWVYVEEEGKQVKKRHNVVCPKKCEGGFAQCGYLPGHEEEKKKQQAEARREKKRKREEEKQRKQEEEQQRKQDTIRETATRLSKRRRQKNFGNPPENANFRSWMADVNLQPSSSPRLLTTALHLGHELEKKGNSLANDLIQIQAKRVTSIR